MQSIKIHPNLYQEMVSLYAISTFKKMFKQLHKSDYVMNIACKTASEFDKTHGIIEVDKIIDFVVLQIIIRITSNNDTTYHNDINDSKDSLIYETGITFDDDDIEDITMLMYNDQTIYRAIQEIAANKILKLQEIFDDDIIYLTKSFCKVVKETV